MTSVSHLHSLEELQEYDPKICHDRKSCRLPVQNGLLCEAESLLCLPITQISAHDSYL